MGEKFDSFAIFAAMRTGSNLLESSLNQFEGLKCHGEMFNPYFIGKKDCETLLGIDLAAREHDPGLLLAKIRESDPACLHGYRLFLDHDPRMIEGAISDPACAKIILKRRPLDSYLSLKRAQLSGQWKIQKLHTRRKEKAVFDADEFESYCADLNAYYLSLENRLRVLGQSWFPMRYEDCKDADILNGLAGYLGIRARITALKEVTRQQSPTGLSDRIENFAEFQNYLARSGYIAIADPLPQSTRGMAAAVRFRTCQTRPVLFAQIPTAPLPGIVADMRALDGKEPKVQKTIEAVQDWVRKTNGPIVFSHVRHPLARAYDVFMERIFLPGDNAFPFVRGVAQKHHGVDLPPAKADNSRAGLVALGHDLMQHRAAFHGFLGFLAKNLAEKTGMQIYPAWASQRAYVDAINAVTPISVLLRDGHLGEGLSYLAALSGAPVWQAAQPEPTHVFTLAEIVTDETDALCRAAYGMDYTGFGFPDWRDLGSL